MHKPDRRSFLHILVTLSLTAASSAVVYAQQAQANTQHYTQTNLVADTPGVAPITDPNLVNAWGLARGSGTPWWVADNGTGVATLYDGAGITQSLVVTVPGGSQGKEGSPTGIVFNGTSGFELAPKKPAIFIFVAEDGTISGWNPGVNPTAAVIKAPTTAVAKGNEKEKSIFKGATIATVDLHGFGRFNLLYVADFHKGRVQIYDSYFRHVPTPKELFNDDQLPPGFAPFNVQNIGGNIFVSYAKQDADKEDEVAGPGLGYVDVFSPVGKLLLRLQHGKWFNAPWGMVQASSDFGAFSHTILVGQFGSGEILAFNPVTGRFKGKLRDAKDQAITIDGLWALQFGNGPPLKAGSATALYFTAGPDDEQHGLFGNITAVENPQGNDQ